MQGVSPCYDCAMADPIYVHLRPDQAPPPLAVGPFKAVVIIEEPVTAEWRDDVSDWLVESGCLYMMAWGDECSLWDDSVDFANLREFDFGDIPDDRSVMTTWHEREPLAEVLWFAAHAAFHSDVPLDRTILVHVAAHEARARLLTAFHDAQID
jgi:hypothetical protein